MQNGYEALRTTCAWIDLTSHGKLRVAGEDAGRLLHAMTTNNIKDLGPGQGTYAFFLTDKGRVIGDAHIFNLGDSYLLDCEAVCGPLIHHHLDKFIIADDAEVKDETARWFEVGIEGPESAAVMSRLGIAATEPILSIQESTLGYVARVASTGPTGFRIWASEETRLALFDRLGSLAIPQASEHEANAVRLENGIPRFGDDISERYLVQETQQLHAVSFNKGCYLGQEIVERIRSQGKVHRLLSSVRITGTLVPAAGSKLGNGEMLAGEITSAAYSPALGEVVGLAYLRSEIVEKRPKMSVAGMDPAVVARVG